MSIQLLKIPWQATQQTAVTQYCFVSRCSVSFCIFFLFDRLLVENNGNAIIGRYIRINGSQISCAASLTAKIKLSWRRMKKIECTFYSLFIHPSLSIMRWETNGTRFFNGEKKGKNVSFVFSSKRNCLFKPNVISLIKERRVQRKDREIRNFNKQTTTRTTTEKKR